MRRQVGRWLWAGAVLGVGAAALLPLFGGGAGRLVLVLVLLAALVLPLVLVAVGRRLSVSPWLIAATTTVGTFVAALTALRVEEPAVALSPWAETPAGRAVGPLADSVAHLLTGPRPAPVEPVYLVPVAVLLAVVALGVGLALDRGRGASLAPLVGAAVLQVAALLVTGGSSDPYGLLAAMLVVVVALGWVVLDGELTPTREQVEPELGRQQGRPRRHRPPSAVAAGAVVAVAVAAVVGAGATGGEPFEPREHVEPPSVDLPTGHPLSHVPAWIAQGDTELFVVRGGAGGGAGSGGGGALPERFALLVLPDFDGATWRADLALRPVGAVASPSLPAGPRQGRLDVEVTVTGLADAVHGVGDWLPTAGVARTVSVPSMHDVDTGSILGTSQERAYRVVADVDQATSVTLTGAPLPSGPTVERYLETPRLPDDLRDLAHAVTADAGSAWEAIVALRDEVREGRDLATDAVTGSSYARLQEFLGGDRDEGGQVGSAEQFAGAFAVLARAVGIPTRVVVGFTVPESDEGADVVVVRGRDAHVWPEVYLVGAGWVAVDPSPAHRSDDSGRDTGTRELPDAEQTAAPEPDAAEDPVAEAAPPGDAGAGRSVLAVVTLVIGASLGVVALAGALTVLVLAVLRARLVARRRRGGAVGAWQHVEDALLLAGAGVPTHEAAPAVAARLGDDVVLLAHRAEAWAFAPSGGEHAGVDDWAVATRCARDLRRGAGWSRRLRWPFAPGPLRRRVAPGEAGSAVGRVPVPVSAARS